MLLSSGTIQQRAEQLQLESNSEQLVFASSVSLWGVIRNTQGKPIGLLLLGPRGDHDPYRAQDLRELGRLLSAAALAFTNSASFEQLARAWRLIRSLYHRVQQIQDQTAFRISRELHHEVNAGVRLNIAALERLISRAAEAAPELVHELEELLKDEQSVSELIRLVCEDLVPVDPRVPMGFTASVDKTAEKATANWKGRWRVVVERPPVAVPSHVQRELLSITREAITNAVKHANADEIVVELQFPLQPDEPLRLSIRDNGSLQQEVEPKAGHLGLHFMQESADAIGATITWLVRETGGTEVQVVAPRNGRPEQEEDAALDEWWSGEQLAAEAGSQDAAELSAASLQQPPDEGRQR
jgi:signal transduction histidine kinase